MWIKIKSTQIWYLISTSDIGQYAKYIFIRFPVQLIIFYMSFSNFSNALNDLLTHFMALNGF